MDDNKSFIKEADRQLAKAQVDAFLAEISIRLGIQPSDLPEMARGTVDFYKSVKRAKEYRKDFISSAFKACGYLVVVGVGYALLYGFKLIQHIPVPIPVP